MIYSVFFSPRGTTKFLTDECSRFLNSEFKTIDLLKEKNVEHVFNPGDEIVLGMPVYAGRIPICCPKMIRDLNFNGAKVVLIASFGNRDIDDALLEMKDLVKEKGGVVVGAAAFVSRHSLFPKVASDRPDDQDKKLLKEFMSGVILNLRKDHLDIKISGNRPYRPYKDIPIKPQFLDLSKCTNCNLCREICPVGMDNCISCGACIEVCPHGVRGYGGAAYKTASIAFQGMHKNRVEPKIFL